MMRGVYPCLVSIDGKLFVDYLSALKRNRIRNKLEKEQRKHP